MVVPYRTSCFCTIPDLSPQIAAMGDGSWEVCLPLSEPCQHSHAFSQNYGDPTRQFQFNPAAQTWCVSNQSIAKLPILFRNYKRKFATFSLCKSGGENPFVQLTFQCHLINLFCEFQDLMNAIFDKEYLQFLLPALKHEWLSKYSCPSANNLTLLKPDLGRQI